MSTCREVAKLAGVSTATVSRAFKSGSSISDETQKKILDVAAQLNYVPNLLARGLKSKKSNIIGLIVSDIDNPFYSVVIQNIEAELKKMYYRIIMLFSNENEQQEVENLSILLSSRVDGIIFTPVSNKNRAIIEAVKQYDIPILQLYRVAYEDIDSLIIDDEKGAYMATKHLIQNGHSRILLVSENATLPPNRESGFHRAFSDSGLDISDDYILHVPFYVTARDLLAKKIKALNPTAIIAVTNTLAIETIKLLKELKISIPDDMSIIIYDDISWVSLFDATAISHPIIDIACSASRIILNRIRRKDANEGVAKSVIDPILISRNSVKYIV